MKAIGDIFDHIIDVVNKGAKTHYNLAYIGQFNAFKLECSEEYSFAPTFEYNGESYFTPSEINIDILEAMIIYIDKYKNGVCKVKLHEPKEKNPSGLLMDVHRISGVEGVNAFLLAGLK